jgi:hypothetical protein
MDCGRSYDGASAAAAGWPLAAREVDYGETDPVVGGPVVGGTFIGDPAGHRAAPTGTRTVYDASSSEQPATIPPARTGGGATVGVVVSNYQGAGVSLASAVGVLGASSPGGLEVPSAVEAAAAASLQVGQAAAPPLERGAGHGNGSGPAGPLARIPFDHLLYRRKLGRGAFGEVEERVWRGVPVAVKCNGLDAGDASALANEVALYERLGSQPHPNIIQVFGVCTDAPGGRLHIVMRLCAKGSLEGVLSAARHEVCVCVLGALWVVAVGFIVGSLWVVVGSLWVVVVLGSVWMVVVLGSMWVVVVLGALWVVVVLGASWVVVVLGSLWVVVVLGSVWFVVVLGALWVHCG